MNRISRRSFLGAIVLLLAACASSGTPPEDRVEPPQMIARGTAPQLRIPTMPSSGRSPVRVTIEVLISETGQADMSTFKLSGFGAPENKEAIAQWIQEAQFRPAHHGSDPVPGIFTMTLEARVVRRGP